MTALTARAGGVKIGIEPDNTLTLNGERFLPLGMVPAPPRDLKTPEGGDGWKELFDGGINYFRAGATTGPWDVVVEEQRASTLLSGIADPEPSASGQTTVYNTRARR